MHIKKKGSATWLFKHLLFLTCTLKKDCYCTSYAIFLQFTCLLIFVVFFSLRSLHFYQIVTRGKVVYTKFKEAANQASEILTEDIQELISPSGRLLVFYVDKQSDMLVADSEKFEVDQKCRDRGVGVIFVCHVGHPVNHVTDQK